MGIFMYVLMAVILPLCAFVGAPTELVIGALAPTLILLTILAPVWRGWSSAPIVLYSVGGTVVMIMVIVLTLGGKTFDPLTFPHLVSFITACLLTPIGVKTIYLKIAEWS